MSRSTMDQWYVIRTKPRQEQVALENLQRQDYRCFYPRIKQMQRRRGKRQLCIEALFPGYLFVKLNLDVTNTAPIRSTRGVTGLVMFGTEIRPIADEVISAIQGKADQLGIIEDDQAEFRAGQQVRIESGAMQGLEAIFQQKSGQDRAILLLNLMGAERTVEIALSDL